jgi:CheY-like chemotaxis protein
VTHKLLLADDSVTIQRVVELTFNGEDVEVVTVGDGEEAIARIPVERPDVVLADIGMPKRSGYDVAAFVKEHADLSHIPVLLLAGAFEPVDEARARQVRCDGVLVKPFEPQQVVARVRELIERRAAPAPALSARAGAVASPASGGDGFGDDYFGGLDAAFQQLEQGRRPPPVSEPGGDGREGEGHEDGEGGDVPTLERVLGPDVTRDRPRDDGAAVAAGRNVIADVFAALFEEEQGQAVAPVAAPPAAGAPPAEVSDALGDEVTRRVTERLAPDAAHPLVARVVSEVAERLIREELERIRSAVEARRQ